MKKVLLTAALLMSTSSAFAAEFYIVQNPTTKRCTIVEQRPAPSVGVVIGRFGVRVEADVRIEERERIRPR